MVFCLTSRRRECHPIRLQTHSYLWVQRINHTSFSQAVRESSRFAIMSIAAHIADMFDALYGSGNEAVQITRSKDRSEQRLATFQVRIGDVLFVRARLSDNEQHLQFFTDDLQQRLEFPLFVKRRRIGLVIQQYIGTLLKSPHRVSRFDVIAELESNAHWASGPLHIIHQKPQADTVATADKPCE